MLKKVLMRVFLFITIFIGTTACVCLYGYEDYLKNKDSENTKITQQEDMLLTNLLNNVIEQPAMNGTLSIKSSDNKTNIQGNIAYLNTTSNPRVNANIIGSINGIIININCIYIDGIIYLKINNSTKFSFATDDFLTTAKNILNEITNGDLSGVLDTSALQSALSNIQTTEIDGGNRIDAHIDGIGSIFVLTNHKDFPTYISANNLNLGNTNYSILINLSPSSNTSITVNKSEYTMITLGDYTHIVGALVKIVMNKGASLSGQITLENGLYSSISLIITSNLEIKATLDLYGITADFYYSKGTITANLLNNTFKITLNELIKLLNNQFNLSINSKLNLKLTNSNQISVNETNSILFNITNGNLNSLSINGENFTANLNVSSSIKTFSIPETNTTLDANQLTTIFNNYNSLLTAECYSIDIDGKANNIAISGDLYLKLDKTFNTLSEFCYYGTIASKYVNIYYKDNNYYLYYNGLKAKFSSKCVSDLYSYLTENTNISPIEINDLSNIFNKYISYTKLYATGKIYLEFSSGGNIQIIPRTGYFDASLTNFNVANTTLSLSARIKQNNPVYKTYLDQLNTSSYTDYSEVSNLVNATKNTLTKNQNTFTGKLSFSLWNWNFYNIDISMKTKYSNGKIILTINLSNLPTSAIITEYNIIGYKNHQLSLTIQDAKISIYRTIQTRFTNKTKIEENYTTSLKALGLADIKNMFGLDNTLFWLFKSTTFQAPTENLIIKMLNNGSIKLVDNSLYVNLINMGLAKYITKADARVRYNSKELTNLNISLSIKNILHIQLNFSK